MFFFVCVCDGGGETAMFAVRCVFFFCWMSRSVVVVVVWLGSIGLRLGGVGGCWRKEGREGEREVVDRQSCCVMIFFLQERGYLPPSTLLHPPPKKKSSSFTFLLTPNCRVSLRAQEH